jgi:hypothetical protein
VSAIKPFGGPLRAIIPRNTVPNAVLTGVISDIADYELSKINRDTLPGNEAAVGADLSRPPPIYRPTATPPHIPMNLLIIIIGLDAHPLI